MASRTRDAGRTVHQALQPVAERARLSARAIGRAVVGRHYKKPAERAVKLCAGACPPYAESVADSTQGVQWFGGGEKFFPAMLGAIDVARATIRLETYIYTNGKIGRQFLEALTQAARRG